MSDKDVSIAYIDMNNLYGSCLSMKLAVARYEEVTMVGGIPLRDIMGIC